MNAFLLMIPFFLVRFGLLGLRNKEALARAAAFAPMQGAERVAYLFYQASNVLIFLYPFFLQVQTTPPSFWAGLALYLIGLAVLILSTLAFAKPGQNGLNTGGIYRLSRNPMYVAYFLYFLGCAVLTRSWLLLLFLLVFQTAAHFIILAEERWCLGRFGSEYASASAAIFDSSYRQGAVLLCSAPCFWLWKSIIIIRMLDTLKTRKEAYAWLI